MKKSIIYLMTLAAAAFTLQSCMDYDNPGDEISVDESVGDATHYEGNIDSIDYMRLPVQEEVDQAIADLSPYFGYSLSAQYAMRGGKENNMPGAHAYQYQYNFGSDAFVGYFVVSHYDFIYANASLSSTYNLVQNFTGGMGGCYGIVKNAVMPLLHHPAIDVLPEVKAINLLYYSIIAQEYADESGAFTYLQDKQNLEKPYWYDDMRTIYYGIVDNIDTIVACLKYFDEKPAWYKDKVINNVLVDYQTSRCGLSGKYDKLIESYWRLANSLKLRMAMHVVKVEPETAKKWAEEAVASGVFEVQQEIDVNKLAWDQDGDGEVSQKEKNTYESENEKLLASESMIHAVYPSVSGFTNPLVEIAGSWSDIRMGASLESILASLDHPYMKYLWKNNSNSLGDMPADSRVIGIRAGTFVGQGQTYALNKYIGYSSFEPEIMSDAPLYFLKLSEVLFLRAEGALRGWNMGGDAKTFYEQGIIFASLDEPQNREWYEDDGYGYRLYTQYLKEYMNREAPVDYVQVDPFDSEAWPSVTKIGVKWNDADPLETKLEKIITQKYIALFPQSTEAWAELRRTGYPRIFHVLNTDEGDGSLGANDFIRRQPWIPSDVEIQQNIEESGLNALGGDDLQGTRIWWDVDVPNF